MQRFFIVGAALILIAAAIPFAYYVWPTKYRYDRLRLGASEFPVRIDRFSGEAERLTPMGWRPLIRPSAEEILGIPLTLTPSPTPHFNHR